MSPRVLVTGSGGPAGRALLTGLVSRGVPVIGVDMVPSSRLGGAFELVPPANDDRFVAAVLDVAVRHRVDLIVPTVSEELPVFARIARGHASSPRIVVAGVEGVEIAHDKWLTTRTLARAGIAVPRAALPSQLPPTERGRVLDVPYLSKPRCGRGGRGVAVHRGSGAADWTLTDDHVLQEYLPGREYAAQLYVADRSADAVVVVLRKIALAQGSIGNATEVQRDPFAMDVASVAAAAARALGLSGPADVDIRRRADGSPVVLEVNARFGAHSAHAPELLDALLTHHRATAAA